MQKHALLALSLLLAACNDSMPWDGQIANYCAQPGVTVDQTFCKDVSPWFDDFGGPGLGTVLLVTDASVYLAKKKALTDNPENVSRDGDAFERLLDTHLIPGQLPTSGLLRSHSDVQLQFVVDASGITVDGIKATEVFRSQYRVILQIPHLLPSSLTN